MSDRSIDSARRASGSSPQFEEAERRTTLAGRRLVVRADGSRRPELAVHALAQLPDGVTLEICGESADAERIELIAAAYGIADRVTFRPDADAASNVLADETLAQLVERWRLPSDPPAASDRDAGPLSGQRVAILTNLPTHYRVPLFNELDARLAGVGAALRVFFLSRLPATRPWMRPAEPTFDHDFVRGVDLTRDRGRRVVPVNLRRPLDAFSPTLLLSSGFSPGVSLRAALYAARRDIPFGLWSGELATRPTARSRLRAIERKWLARQASFAIAYGSQSAGYLRSLCPDLPLVLGRNTTFAPPARASSDRRGTLEVLAVGRAIEDKSLDVAVEAVRRVPGLACRLAVVGDGPLLAELAGLRGGDERIDLLGAIPSDEMSTAYSEADVFLFPSSGDIFGLALVEAMGAGLATIVSEMPGAVADLCVSEVNCLIVDRDPENWASALRTLADNRKQRLALGEAARRTIRSRWTIAHAADAMMSGFRLGLLNGGQAR
jgi:glycosyltransferase involved in cell wall biosynthesis